MTTSKLLALIFVIFVCQVACQDETHKNQLHKKKIDTAIIQTCLMLLRVSGENTPYIIQLYQRIL